MSVQNIHQAAFENMCGEYRQHNQIGADLFERYGVKRGLRNADGSGVMAGITGICNVHGYVINEGEKSPVEGRLVYRGVDVYDLVRGCVEEDRFGFEEVAWLLIFGQLPTADQLAGFRQVLEDARTLPNSFAEDMIIKAPSPNIMNKMARSVMALYSYDEAPEDPSLENRLRQAVSLIAMLPSIMYYAYQVKRRYYDKENIFLNQLRPGQSTAETILNGLRMNGEFAPEEARLLDLCLMLHAEHGGGNNSSFTARVLASTGTDLYSAVGAAIGSLKGPKHGGANAKVMQMKEYIQNGVKNWEDDDEVLRFLKRMINKQEGDRSGLIYGMGHAIYTLSDPRAVLLKKHAWQVAEHNGFGAEFRLLESVERLAPRAFAEVKGLDKPLCANVDLYSGLVYQSLGIAPELYTPMFALARIAGWCAHYLEEAFTDGKIMRPAYKPITKPRPYQPLAERG
ncbi:MAG: citrate synthase [Acutalibacteraceae bacterium]|jgi:citrate synthase